MTLAAGLAFVLAFVLSALIYAEQTLIRCARFSANGIAMTSPTSPGRSRSQTSCTGAAFRCGIRTAGR